MHLYTSTIDKEVKLKADFMYKKENTSISKEVTKMLLKKAKEYDKMIKNK